MFFPLAMRERAGLASTLITHKHSPKKVETKRNQKQTAITWYQVLFCPAGAGIVGKIEQNQVSFVGMTEQNQNSSKP